VPALRTLISPRAASDRPQNLTSALLTMMSAQGRIVRGTPVGPWTSRHHRWEPIEQWWPDGLPELDAEDSQRELARRWLIRFGPATVGDLPSRTPQHGCKEPRSPPRSAHPSNASSSREPLRPDVTVCDQCNSRSKREDPPNFGA
jgi:hypothetical protein